MKRRTVMAIAARALVACALLPVAAFSTSTRAQSGPSVVILVRHAEKAAVAGNDPPLSELGTQRAEALAAAVAASLPRTIIVTPLQRTAMTAAVVAKQTGVTPQAIPLDGGTATHVAAVAAAVNKASGVVMVVGHSNTIPAIIKALGGPALPDICDATYSHLFVFTPAHDGVPSSLVMSRYGANEAAPPATCVGMAPK